MGDSYDINTFILSEQTFHSKSPGPIHFSEVKIVYQLEGIVKRYQVL